MQVESLSLFVNDDSDCLIIHFLQSKSLRVGCSHASITRL